RASAPRWYPRMQVRPQRPLDGVLSLFDGERLVTTYHVGPEPGPPGRALTLRRPFFYPVHDPDGHPLTGFGKPHDPSGSHDHHSSLWVAHASVDGRDFWGEKGGVIAHERFDLIDDGPVFCRLEQSTRWADGGSDLLHERRRLTLYRAEEGFQAL